MARLRMSHHASRRYSDVRTVECDTHNIRTVVTDSPSVVRDWLYKIRSSNPHRLRRSRLLAGVGVQWTPYCISGRQTDTPATLQLCVGHQFLIFQLSKAQRVPFSLRRFLRDRHVNNRRDEEQLRNCSKEEMSMTIGKLIDLVDVASKARRCGKVISMERLAKLELGMRVRKDLEVGKSDWDGRWLSDAQIEYACVDAFVSFSVGKRTAMAMVMKMAMMVAVMIIMTTAMAMVLKMAMVVAAMMIMLMTRGKITTSVRAKDG